MRYKTVIFDMDGTLIDSLEGLGDAANTTLKELGFSPHPLEQYRYFVGEGARKLAEQILPEKNRDEATIQTCLDRFLAQYQQVWDQKSKLYEGVAELLDELSALGIELAILSNKPDDFTKAFADRYLNRWQFREILGSSEVVPHKPNPLGVVRILDRFGCAPEDCLFVGDSKIDMETAINSGTQPVGVLWGFRSREELMAHGARWLIERPEQLLEILKPKDDL